ncbi:MAG TPA: hypothetical protein VJ417_09500, partial [Candidatus Glassbacteria bacterium]|nr:hypothetical protein [Candidatus Glassbacteria bacterium]
MFRLLVEKGIPAGVRLFETLIILTVLFARPAAGADSLSLKLPPSQGVYTQNRLGHKPYKPLFKINTVSRSKVEYDLESNVVVESISIPSQDSEMLLEVHYWSVLEYLQALTKTKEDSTFEVISSQYISGAEAIKRQGQTQGLMPEINLPDFMPKSLASIIGEG